MSSQSSLPQLSLTSSLIPLLHGSLLLAAGVAKSENPPNSSPNEGDFGGIRVERSFTGELPNSPKVLLRELWLVDVGRPVAGDANGGTAGASFEMMEIGSLTARLSAISSEGGAEKTGVGSSPHIGP